MWKDFLYEAYLSLANNKLRSFLSILGVLIGVAAVIAMLALGTGAKQQMKDRFASLGTNLLTIQPNNRYRGMAGVDGGTRFTFADETTLRRISGITDVVPYVRGQARVVYKNRNWNTNIYGTTSNYQRVKNAAPSDGRFFSPTESLGRSKIAVLGQTVVKELFGDEDPLGKFVRINRVSFQVIGILPAKGSGGWQNPDDQIVVPVKTAMYRLLGKDFLDYFDVQINDQAVTVDVQDEIVSALLANHRLPADQVDRIEIRNMAEIQQAASDMMNTLSLLLGGIAAISLLVGGIGIMNIMLVMVMERTREIGLRKALGAKKRDIMLQFLVESVLVCVFGGVLGILFGTFVSWLASTFAGWVTLISLWSIVLAFSFSVGIGMIFGLWPAWRASNLTPVEALRYE